MRKLFVIIFIFLSTPAFAQQASDKIALQLGHLFIQNQLNIETVEALQKQLLAAREEIKNLKMKYEMPKAPEKSGPKESVE